jgi:glutamate-1-semialdehyde 2,1-aminomutase
MTQDPYPSNACPAEKRRAVIERFVSRTPGSKRAHEKAVDVLPAGVNRNIVHHGPHPLFVERAEGPYLFDPDGNRYLDLIANYTAMVLGNAVPEIVRAAEAQIRNGTAWAAASPGEAELASMIVERIPSAERVRFAASGTEATMMAMRAARAHTGRAVIAKFEGGYHGLSDFAMVSVAPDPDASGPDEAPNAMLTPGLAPAIGENLIVLPFNQPEDVKPIVEKNASRLAGIIVEPVMGNAGLLMPQTGFLELLRDLANKHGIVLIFDEVISFRLAYGGAQALYGVTPDLTTLGKIIGGGFPIGAVCGRADIMQWFDPTKPGGAITLSGTFHAAPVALAAGVEAMKLFDRAAIEKLNARSAQLADELRAVFAGAALPLSLNQCGSLLNLHVLAEAPQRYRPGARGDKMFLKLLHLALLNEGLLVSPRGLFCTSVPMSEADYNAIVDGFARALTALGVLPAERERKRA